MKFVKDRPGHDFKYVIDNNVAKFDLKWDLKFSLDEGLLNTIGYYQKFFLENTSKIKGSKFFRRKG
jgi:dTDP-D-glucose 4,6-dehydratase